MQICVLDVCSWTRISVAGEKTVGTHPRIHYRVLDLDGLFIRIIKNITSIRRTFEPSSNGIFQSKMYIPVWAPIGAIRPNPVDEFRLKLCELFTPVTRVLHYSFWNLLTVDI